MADPGGREAVAAVWRMESARIVGALARYTGDFAMAEDLAQEALAEALVSWPRDGVPAKPVGWLLTVGRRRAIDAFRRRAALHEKYAASAGAALGSAAPGSAGLATAAPATPSPATASPATASPAVAGRDADLLWDPDRIDDDALALMFISCHPVLSREARVALTLRVVGGLTSDEIASAFLVPAATIQARITRAKKALAAAGVPFEVPPAGERSERLGSVLTVIYLIFTAGSSASSGDELIRFDLAGEAQRLARVLARLVPDEPEVYGLLALLELTAARFPARTGPGGDPVLLEQQDRARWDHAAIRRGRAALARAKRAGRGLGAYGLQAAIAECHAVAPSVSETDWERVVALYETLGKLAPSPVVDLNRAVAVAMARGPAAALPIVDDVREGGALAKSHLLPGVRGELMARLGRDAEARAELERAVALCGNERERAVLQRKIASLTRTAGRVQPRSDGIVGRPRLGSMMMRREQGPYFAGDDAPVPDDLGLAWDAAERYAVTLLWEALPETQSMSAPAEELTAQADRFRSAARKWPYKQLARATWGQRPPADDTDLWLDAAGAMATMRRHVGIDSPSLEPVTLLRPADWAGAVIGMVRSGVNTVVTSWDLVRYAGQCPEIAGTREPGDEAPAYDPFAGGVVDDESLWRGFEAALVFWQAIGAVNEQQWLTRLGFWGLPRALARAWNGDFDGVAWVDSTEFEAREGRWPGLAPSPADLGIHEPPVAT